MRDLRTRLIVPTALAMSSFAACGDDKPSTTSTTQTETSSETTSATQTETSSDTTMDATTGEPTTGDVSTSGTTSEDTSSETGGLPDCSVFDGDMAACQAMVGCAWEFEAELCIVDCTLIDDEATCNAAMVCFWSENFCYPPI